jgi:phosphoglycerate dehydrogenase-like enzyme
MKILIHIQWPVKAWSIPDTHAAALQSAFPEVEFVRVHNIDDAARAIVDVDACFTPILRPGMAASAPKLRWVHSPAAAVEGLLPLAELAAHGVMVTNSKGVQAIPMAEHVMGGILVLSRRFDRTLAAQREKQWIQNDLTNEWPWLLHGQHMTIVGLGTIGMEIAKRAHAFGIHVTGVRRTVDAPKPSFVDSVAGPDQLNSVLHGCDMLVLSAPGVSSTHRMIGAEQLALLNRGALLVNVARAGIVDDAAMRAALDSGQLGGAVLDVFEHEPLEASNALWTTPNVVLTPHSSGFRASHWNEVSTLFSENLRRYQRGETLQNVVDLAAGY